MNDQLTLKEVAWAQVKSCASAAKTMSIVVSVTEPRSSALFYKHGTVGQADTLWLIFVLVYLFYYFSVR